MGIMAAVDALKTLYDHKWVYVPTDNVSGERNPLIYGLRAVALESGVGVRLHVGRKQTGIEITRVNDRLYDITMELIRMKRLKVASFNDDDYRAVKTLFDSVETMYSTYYEESESMHHVSVFV